jgi:hypothetical protein
MVEDPVQHQVIKAPKAKQSQPKPSSSVDHHQKLQLRLGIHINDSHNNDLILPSSSTGAPKRSSSKVSKNRKKNNALVDGSKLHRSK